MHHEIDGGIEFCEAGVRPGSTVTVIGDGAVGLSVVIAANRLGAERIILMCRHTDRTDLGREFGATDVVAARSEEGIAALRDLTGGDGTHAVLECVGTRDALETAFAMTRPGGTVSRVGAPQYEEFAMGFPTIFASLRPGRAESITVDYFVRPTMVRCCGS